MSKMPNNVHGSRTVVSGFNLPSKQANFHPSGMQQEISIIPSTSNCNWSGLTILDLKNKNIEMKNISLQFNLSGLGNGKGGLSYTGKHVVSRVFNHHVDTIPAVQANPNAVPPILGTPEVPGYDVYDNILGPSQSELPYLVPGVGFFSRIEIVQNNIILDTYFPSQQFILQNIIYSDKERLSINNAMGNYNSVKQRQYKCAQANSEYLVHLRTFIDQSRISILSNSHEIQLRLYMANLNDIVVIPLGDDGAPCWSGTPQVTVSCSAVVHQNNINANGLAIQRSQSMAKMPHHTLFHDIRFGLYNSVSGAVNQRLVLTSIVGKISHFFFVLRENLTGANAFKYSPITSWELLNNGGTNIIGGSVLTTTTTKKLLSKISKSTYHNETPDNSNFIGEIQDNGSYVYFWSFAEAKYSVEALENGVAYGSHTFTGNEILNINFIQGLQKAYTIEVYAYCENILEHSLSHVKKITL